MTAPAEISIHQLAYDLYELKTAVDRLTKVLVNQAAASPSSGQEWLSTGQVCTLFGIDPRTWTYLRAKRETPTGYRLGAKELRYKRAEIEAWAASRAEA